MDFINKLVGDESSLEVGQKINEIIDFGNSKLNTAKMYETGSVSTDKQGYNQLEKMYHSTFDLSKFTVVGNPTITSDGVASGFSGNDYLYIPANTIPLATTTQKHIVKFKLTSLPTGSAVYAIIGSNLNYGDLVFGINSTTLVIRCKTTNASSNSYDLTKDISLSQLGSIINTDVVLTHEWNGLKHSFSIIINGTSTLLYEINNNYPIAQTNNLWFGEHNPWKTDNSYLFIDFKHFSITVDGKEVFNGNKTGLDVIGNIEIPYTESKTGSKVVDVAYRDRVQDVYEQYGQAGYYTIDEENKNFTLPMGEIYGMLVDKDLSNLSETGRAVLDDKANVDLLNATKESGLRRLVEVSDLSLLPSWYKVFEEVNPSTGEVRQWCEQGGVGVGGTDNSGATIFFMKGYSDAYGVPNGNINVQATVVYDEETLFENGSAIGVKIRFVTPHSFKASTTYTGSAAARYEAHSFRWKAEGYIEQGEQQ